jgi:tRNA threonylcarbamoyladenosine biosynthesis protein TsaB
MRILALETSGKSGSVAVAEDAKTLHWRELAAEQRSAQSVAPAIQRLLDYVSWRPMDLELIALTVGPGSFTGLRVGVATAKVLGYATGAEVLGVNTLDVIAFQATTDRPQLAVAMDAQRSQVVASTFVRNRNGDWQSSGKAALLGNDAWLASLDAETAVTGPALEKLQPQLPRHVTVVDPAAWTPRAETVARLAFRRYHAGERNDIWSLTPLYIRKSAAEEKLEPRQVRLES